MVLTLRLLQVSREHGTDDDSWQCPAGGKRAEERAEKLKGEYLTMGIKASWGRRRWASPWRMNRFSQVETGWARLQGKGHLKCRHVDRETRATW